jgi:hypothetical protein
MFWLLVIVSCLEQERVPGASSAAVRTRRPSSCRASRRVEEEGPVQGRRVQQFGHVVYQVVVYRGVLRVIVSLQCQLQRAPRLSGHLQRRGWRPFVRVLQRGLRGGLLLLVHVLPLQSQRAPSRPLSKMVEIQFNSLDLT